MKNSILFLSLILCQLMYGQYKEVTLKELNENGSNYLNQNVSVICNKIKSSGNEVLTNMEGETEFDDTNFKIDDGKPKWINNEVFTVLDSDYNEFSNCYLFDINSTEFMDKFYDRDIVISGKVVKWDKKLGQGDIGLKVTDVETQITIHNLFNEHPFWFVFSIGILFFLLLVVIRIFIPQQE